MAQLLSRRDAAGTILGGALAAMTARRGEAAVATADILGAGGAR